MSEFRTATDEAARAQEKVIQIAQEVKNWEARRKVHDDNNPGVCEPGCEYNKEAARFDAEGTEIKRRGVNAINDAKYATTHLSVVWGRIRIAAQIRCLRPFTEQIQHCAEISNPRQAEGCLRGVWANSTC